MIYLSPPDFGSDMSIDLSNTTYDSIFEAYDEFESSLQETLKTTKPILGTQSGTAALHLALKLCDVKEDDYVLCQSLTFVSCASVIKYQGAHPVFIDSESQTGNMCPFHLKEAILNLQKLGIVPKAVIIVHLYGNPAKVLELKNICDQFNIRLIEDAAEALGSSYNGQMCGTLGDFGILSFNYNKIVSAAGGGALICNTTEYKEKALFYATQAKEREFHYQHNEIGYNYRISHIQAILGITQLKRLSAVMNKRLGNYSFYEAILNEIPEIYLNNGEEAHSISNRWLNLAFINPIYFDIIKPSIIHNAFSEAKIETRPIWKPLHLQPVFKGARYYGETVAQEWFHRGLCLPSGSNLTIEDRKRIESVIFTIFKGM